jgi:hypothetical protein
MKPRTYIAIKIAILLTDVVIALANFPAGLGAASGGDTVERSGASAAGSEQA